MQTAYSYLRFSNPKQIKGNSRHRQLKLARKYADTHSLYLDESLTFQDLGVSAYRGDNLETGRLGDFFRAVEQGFVSPDSYLLVESLDRISRDKARRALRVLEDICDAGITVVTLLDDQVFTTDRLDNDPTALLISLVVFLRANEESNVKARRQREAWDLKFEEARSTGKILTRKVPAWLEIKDNRIVAIPERAKIVRQIFELASVGIGKDAIAAKLNRDKVPTFQNAPHWSHTRIREILISKAVIGRFVSKSWAQRGETSFKPIEGYFPSVINKALYNKTQKVLEARRAKWPGSKHGKLRNLFSPLAKCPKCGSTMARAYRIYFEKGVASVPNFICRSAQSGAVCDYIAVLYDPIEESFRASAPAMLARFLDGKRPTPTTSAFDPIIFGARVADLKQSLVAAHDDIPLLNRKIRNVFSKIVIDYPNSRLLFHWLNGLKTEIRTEMSPRAFKRNRLPGC